MTDTIEAAWRKAIADQVRANCTPSSEAYAKAGDTLIYAVADWIENPPEWSQFTAPTVEPAAGPSVPIFPKLIAVNRVVGEASLLIDGVPFPYAISSVTVAPSTDKYPTVVLEIAAERVTVEDSMKYPSIPESSN